MNKLKIILAIATVLVIAWWFRFDTHCADTTYCVSFDRFTGQWINPYQEKIKQEQLDEISSYSKTFNYEKALLAGYSHDEIIKYLTNQYNKKQYKLKELLNSPEYKKLSSSEQEDAINEYFEFVVKPHVPEEDLVKARGEFDTYLKEQHR